MDRETQSDSRQKDPMPERETEGVKILLGEPKKAIIKLSIPMIIALSANTIYNVVDAIWVSGLGADALAAVGFFFPFLFMAMALSIGIGVGGGSAISRRIGAKDKSGADKVSAHTLVIMLIAAVLFTIPLFVFSDAIFSSLGAGRTTDMAASYARVMFAGTIIIFFMNVGTSLLRAEGDAKRTMYAMMLGSVINVVLDPIFIYILDFGVVGAAWATLISMSCTSLILFYWMFIKKDTFVQYPFSLSKFRFQGDILKDIFKVGGPASVLQLSMSIQMLIFNLIIVGIAGTDGVAVFTTGWRVSMIAILPLIGIATAVVSVSGAAFGAKDYSKLKISFLYAVRVGLIIETIVAILTFIFAPQITAVFTFSEDTARIAGDMTIFFRIIFLFYPGVALGMMSSSMFQGSGKGSHALVITLVRTLVLGIPMVYGLAVMLGWGLVGVWWGIVLGNVCGSLIAFTWANIHVRGLLASQSVKVEESDKI